MNQTQLKYARERAETVFKRAKDALKKKHTTDAIDLSHAEVRQALGNRQFKVLSDGSGWRLRDFVSFPSERPSSFDRDAYEADLKELQASYDKLTDELVLGDSQEALELLKAFEAATSAAS